MIFIQMRIPKTKWYKHLIPTCLAYHIAEPLPHSATSTSSTTWRTPTLLQLCYLQQALPTHDQLDSPPLNDTTTSYCLPTLPTRRYDTSGVSPTRPWKRGILPPPTLLQHPPDRDRAQTFKVNVHSHILHSSWLAATDSLWNQGHTAVASPSRLVTFSASETWEYHPEFTRPIVSILLMFLSMSSYP